MKHLAGFVSILLLVLVTSQQSSAGLDREVVKAKLTKLCQDENITIESVEEIDVMRDLINSRQVDHQSFSSCQTHPLKPLTQLHEISKNVNCGRVKNHEISIFHWTYVIGSIDSKWQEAHESTLPAALLRYFIDFVTKLGEKCAHQLDDNLEKLATSLDSQSREILKGSLEAAGLNHALHMLVDKKDIKKYDDFLLLWQALANKYKRRGVFTMDDVNDMKENTFSHVVLQNTAKVEWIQRQCSTVFGPIYQETTLPVMNLIDLGYGQYWSLDKVSERVKEWYQLTQLCELALGVQFYYDETAVLPKVIDEDEDTDASQVGFRGRHLAKPPTELTQITDLSDFVSSDSSISTKSKANEVRANIKSRAAVKRMMMKNLVKFACRHPLSSIRNMIARAAQNTVPEIKSALLINVSMDPEDRRERERICPVSTKSLQLGVSSAPVTLVKLAPQLLIFIVVGFLLLSLICLVKLLSKLGR